MTGTINFENPEPTDPRSTGETKVRAALIKLKEEVNALLTSENKVEGSKIAPEAVGMAQLAKAAKLGTWYTPTVIATEQTTTSTSWTQLETPDVVANVVLPTNGLIVLGYQALWKPSVKGAGHAKINIGLSELKVPGINAPVSAEVATYENGTGWGSLASSVGGLHDEGHSGNASLVSTGMAIAAGPCFIWASAGTYAVALTFRVDSGSLSVKERKLWVATLGY